MSIPVACTELQHNGDVSGIGVRASFYIQTVCLALQCLRAASHSANITRAEDALIALSITSLAYSTATIALGISSRPSLNLYDAVVVVYLNLLACPVVVFLQYKNSRNIKQRTRSNWSKKMLERMGPLAAENGLTFAVILQTCLFLSCLMVVFGKASTFGKTPQCNPFFVISVFHPFPIFPTSRRVILGIFGAATVTYVGYYAFLVAKAAQQYLRTKLPGTTAHPAQSNSPQEGKKVFDWKFSATTAALLIISTIHIANTELLKIYNEKKTSKVDNTWTFGQILPLFLAAYSVWSAFKTFWDAGGLKNPIGRRHHSDMVEGDLPNLEIPFEGREPNERMWNNEEVMYYNQDR